ncbi:amino acid ABC transporter ATP-binding protein [Alphaproteobacteria bacterium LMG 31809]|uniref:Amino acid ABC transporter ATP-binding protein n=2 Tax=Govanella unica TaxID=2975056 RepID=A0A9X3TXM3_9PROT|nr:amino acid ABC transporter ATP-binding protein [Govania unica]
MDCGAHIHKSDDHAESTVIEITGLNKWYDSNHVLKDVALSVQAGDKVVICGPSGSGKSTLIRCINGLEPHQSGTLIVQGNRLDTARKIHASRQTVGMVFQQFNLFPHLTVLENLVLAPKLLKKVSHAVAVERAMHYLKKVKLADYCGRYPGQLSGGQQQRVAIARALCMQPSIMLFDEPTSALDPETIGEVLDTMIELADSGMTMLCVTHEMTFARRVANRILFMDQGQILEDRKPDDFFENPGTDRLKRFLSQILSH